MSTVTLYYKRCWPFTCEENTNSRLLTALREARNTDPKINNASVTELEKWECVPALEEAAADAPILFHALVLPVSWPPRWDDSPPSPPCDTCLTGWPPS